MSILSSCASLFVDLTSLLFPPRCAACEKELKDGEIYICTTCRLNIPLTGFWLRSANPMAERLRALRPQIVEASAMFYFFNNSHWRDMIHRIKYHQFWRDGYNMGRWFGLELRRSTLYDEVDIVMATPLHPIKLFQRGYNQSEFIARGIARSMSLPYDGRTLYRRHHRLPQARSLRSERWHNMSDMFGVKKHDHLHGKHILLVDDVFTTGATTLACAEVILDNIPDVRVSIVTLAASSHELNVRM
ncbi:MAG: ComF family protein [Rikenellaceae bacterium]